NKCESDYYAAIRREAALSSRNSAKRFPMGRVRKLSKTLSYGSRWKTQQNAFLWVALENSAKRFPMGRVLGLVLY
ncbi:hypothetical protein, partial [Leptospira interrogans]